MAWTDNMRDYWRLNEASDDAAGAFASKTFTQVGTVGNNTGLVYSTAREFGGVGTTDGFSRNNSDVRFGDVDFTVAVWFYEYSVPAGESPTLYHYLVKNDTFNGGYTIGINNDSAIFFQSIHGDGSADVLHGSSGACTINTWHLAILWHTAADNVLHIVFDNGTEATESGSANRAAGAAVVYFGREGGSTNNTFEGRLGPIAMWERVLTADEKTALWNDGDGKTYESMVSVVHTETGSAVSAHAVSGADVLYHVYQDNGAAQHTKQASSADILINAATGQTARPTEAAGSDALISAAIGEAQHSKQSGGADILLSPDTGQAVSSHAASGLDALVNVTSGAAQHSKQISGIDVSVSADTGSVSSPRVPDGLDVQIAADTGASEAPHVASGIDVYTPRGAFTDTGEVQHSKQISGADGLLHIYAEDGQTAAPLSASGSDALVNADTGIVEMPHSVSGADVYAPTVIRYTDTGDGISTAQASGADVVIAAEAGANITPHVATGADSGILAQSGEAQAPHVASASDVFANIVSATATHSCSVSGLDALINVATGGATSTRAGSAYDQLFAKIVYVETGAVESPHVASGFDTVAIAGSLSGGAGGWVSYKAFDEMNSDEDEVLMLAAELLL